MDTQSKQLSYAIPLLYFIYLQKKPPIFNLPYSKNIFMLTHHPPTHTYTHAHKDTYIYIYTYTHTHTNKHTHKQIHLNTHTRTQTHTQTHTHTHRTFKLIM